MLDIQKIRKQMGSGSADSGASSATSAAVRLVPIRPVRIPGATFALGDTLEGLVFRYNLSPDAGSAAGPNERVFAGDFRYFGQDAHGKLHFNERWLSRAEIQTGPLTSAVRRYIVDEFLRQGYRRACTKFEERMVDCDWTGRTVVKMQLDSAGVIVDVTLPDEPVAVAAAPPATSTVLPETLSITRSSSTGRTAPVPLTKAAPAYPAAARDGMVQGVVEVLALVDESGQVIDARVGRGVPELNDAALTAVRNWRFQPYADQGRAVRFWVTVPVRFTLH
jgi:TonB family protein